MKFLIGVIEWVRLVPKGTATITEDLLNANDALFVGGSTGILTPMFLCVLQKDSVYRKIDFCA